MYGNNRFKLLSVDGVKPSRNTIASDKYQLYDYYYAVIRKDTPDDSPARALIEWLLSDEGQALAISAGYIPLKPMDNILPDDDVDPIYLGDKYNSSGTGGTVLKPDADLSELVVNGVRKPLSDLFFDGFNYVAYFYTLSVNVSESPQIEAKINEQLKVWAVGIFGDPESARLIESYVNSDFYSGRLQPQYGRWKNYLSVYYEANTFGGPMFSMPMIQTICFDINSGDQVRFAGLIPADLDYSNAWVYIPYDFESEQAILEEQVENYNPPDGSTITDAWLRGSNLSFYLTEPDGRKLLVLFIVPLNE